MFILVKGDSSSSLGMLDKVYVASAFFLQVSVNQCKELKNQVLLMQDWLNFMTEIIAVNVEKKKQLYRGIAIFFPDILEVILSTSPMSWMVKIGCLHKELNKQSLLMSLVPL